MKTKDFYMSCGMSEEMAIKASQEACNEAIRLWEISKLDHPLINDLSTGIQDKFSITEICTAIQKYNDLNK